MRRLGHACAHALGLLLVLAGSCESAWAQLQAPSQASVLVAPQGAPPTLDAAWRPVGLPDDAARSRPDQRQQPAWYRIQFEGPDRADAFKPWAAFIPYFFSGGSVWLNGELLATMPSSSEVIKVWSYRPALVPLQGPLLRKGSNELMVWVARPDKHAMLFPRVSVGPQAELLPHYDRRFFWTRTVPGFTVLGSFLVAAYVLLIWARRPAETLYGLFGLAAILWGIRSLNSVVDVLPIAQWHWWRVFYVTSTGGFVIAMALFTLRLAGLQRPWRDGALIAFGLVGPLWFALRGFSADLSVTRWWLGGMILVGIGIVLTAFWSVWQRRTWSVAILAASLTFALLVGIHDYLLVWMPALLARWLPEWVGQRILLLHFGSSAMLLAMGGAVTARYIDSLSSLEDLNRTLETRVADRERALAANYEQLAALQREHAVAEERQLIMRDLHDGLGSQLFTSLSRVERGDMDDQQIAAALRGCIADMRLALDALASGDNDVGAAVGSFMFRWKTQLSAAGVRLAWDIDASAAPARTTCRRTTCCRCCGWRRKR